MLTDRRRDELQAAKSAPSREGKSPGETCFVEATKTVWMSGFVLSCCGGEKYPTHLGGRSRGQLGIYYGAAKARLGIFSLGEASGRDAGGSLAP